MIPASKRKRILDAVYGAAIETERWPQALTLVADAIGAIGGMVVFHPPREAGGFLITGRLREDLSDLYMRRHTTNVMACAMRRAPLDQPLLANTLVDMRSFQRTEMYADIFVPQKIEGIANIALPSLTSPGGSGGFGFPLSARQLDQSDVSLRVLQDLQEHLSRAVDLSLSLGKRLAAEPHLTRAIAAMPGPTLLLDDRSGILFANQPAEDLLAEADGLSVRCTETLRLFAFDEAENSALHATIRSSVAIARGQDAGRSGVVRISRRSRPALTVLITPLPDTSQPFGLALEPRTRVLAQVLGLGRVPGGRTRAFCDLFQLTVAEARVAACIGEGMSVPEVADALGLSRHTVRTQLRNCFDKTGARSQVDLARLLGATPPN